MGLPPLHEAELPATILWLADCVTIVGQSCTGVGVAGGAVAVGVGEIGGVPGGAVAVGVGEIGGVAVGEGVGGGVGSTTMHARSTLKTMCIFGNPIVAKSVGVGRLHAGALRYPGAL